MRLNLYRGSKEWMDKWPFNFEHILIKNIRRFKAMSINCISTIALKMKLSNRSSRPPTSSFVNIYDFIRQAAIFRRKWNICIRWRKNALGTCSFQVRSMFVPCSFRLGRHGNEQISNMKRTCPVAFAELSVNNCDFLARATGIPRILRFCLKGIRACGGDVRRGWGRLSGCFLPGWPTDVARKDGDGNRNESSAYSLVSVAVNHPLNATRVFAKKK